jgi:membrane protein implicated in regulation of membrane protease activity
MGEKAVGGCIASFFFFFFFSQHLGTLAFSVFLLFPMLRLSSQIFASLSALSIMRWRRRQGKQPDVDCTIPIDDLYET